MAKIDVLKAGYSYMVSDHGQQFATPDCKTTKQRMRATGSSCLIRSNNLTILFDTLGPWEKDILISELARRSIAPADIDYLICSHSHPDHIGNINLFTEAKLHIIGTSVYSGDEYHLDKFEPVGSFKFSWKGTDESDTIDVINYRHFEVDSNVKVLPTSGHTMDCISVIVDDNELGKVALVGDLFENEQDLHDERIWLSAGSQQPDFQRANRAMIFNQVDYILPGHGPLFKADGKLPC